MVGFISKFVFIFKMKILYDGEEKHGEYLVDDRITHCVFLEAGFKDGEYSAGDFINRIGNISLTDLTEHRRIVTKNRGAFLTCYAKKCKTVTIEDFALDEEEIELFIQGV